MPRRWDPELSQWTSLVQSVFYAACGAWAAATFPPGGGWTPANGRLLVGGLFLFFSLAWFEAFRRFRCAAKADKAAATKKARDWSA